MAGNRPSALSLQAMNGLTLSKQGPKSCKEKEVNTRPYHLTSLYNKGFIKCIRKHQFSCRKL